MPPTARRSGPEAMKRGPAPRGECASIAPASIAPWDAPGPQRSPWRGLRRRLQAGQARWIALAAAFTLAASILAVAAGAARAVGGFTVTAPAGLNVRGGPGTGYPVVGHLGHGAALDISCQIHSGSFVNGSDVWDQIPGGYVTDYYVSTAAFNAYTPGIAACGGAGAAPARTRIVVMGDSYASGEGTWAGARPAVPSVDYYPDTANGTDECHRSPAAYAPLLGVTGADFVACSGTKIYGVINGYAGEGGSVPEPSQLKTLDTRVRTVILSAGGNDLDFETVLTRCTNLPGNSTNDQDCFGSIDDSLNNKMPNMLDALSGLLKQIQAPDRTNGAQVIVVGYPRLFARGGYLFCSGINPARQVKLNQATDRVDDAIRSEVGKTPGATFVDVRPFFVGHEVCGATGESYINDLQLELDLPPLTIPLPGGNRLQIHVGTNNCPPTARMTPSAPRATIRPSMHTEPRRTCSGRSSPSVRKLRTHRRRLRRLRLRPPWFLRQRPDRHSATGSRGPAGSEGASCSRGEDRASPPTPSRAGSMRGTPSTSSVRTPGRP